MRTKNSTYYLAETYEDNLQTASIIRKDNEKILLQLGFSPLRFNHIKEGSVIVKIRRLIEIARLALGVKKGDTVVFHFPLLANAYKVLFGLLRRKGVQTIALIIDIDGLRYHNQELLKKELALLDLFTHMIAHNDAMRSFLSTHIHEDRISSIEVFDYPATKNIPERSLSRVVCFAGNFEKAAFTNKLHQIENIRFNLYGPSWREVSHNNLSYKGSFASHELPGILEGSFGLVWDGSDMNNCDDYLLYNNPYKMSLYIAAGLPLIVWEKSAVASLVQQYNIGILIRSLYDMEAAINNLPEEHYRQMIHNLLPLREKLCQGYFLKHTLEKLPGLTAV